MVILEQQSSQLPTCVIRAFSANHVVRLTSLSQAQLRYWDNTRFFRPRYAFENRRSPFSRVYSFQDVVGLRTLSHLRKIHKIPPQQLRKVARQLSEYRDRPWSELILYVLGKEVYFREPETERIRGVLSGQYTLVHLESIIHDLTEEAEQLKLRSREQIGHIERHRLSRTMPEQSQARAFPPARSGVFIRPGIRRTKSSGSIRRLPAETFALHCDTRKSWRHRLDRRYTRHQVRVWCRTTRVRFLSLRHRRRS